jgi:voltage-gated sodium channel
MGRLVRGFVSDRVVMSMVVLNTVALFLVETYAEGTFAGHCWHWVDYVCVVYFLIEAIIKIRLDGWRMYWSSNWNRFDLILVIISLPALLTPLGVHLGVLANVLVLRLGRLFRLFRVLRLIPDLDRLTAGVTRALRASVGVFLALFLINFILAMAATILFRDADPERFGNPFRSSYSIFQVFTVEGWYEVPAAVERAAEERAARGELDNPETVAMTAQGFFVVAVIVGGILGLSLANAVFVDEMMADNTHELERRVEELATELKGLRADLARRQGKD